MTFTYRTFSGKVEAVFFGATPMDGDLGGLNALWVLRTFSNAVTLSYVVWLCPCTGFPSVVQLFVSRLIFILFPFLNLFFSAYCLNYPKNTFPCYRRRPPTPVKLFSLPKAWTTTVNLCLGFTPFVPLMALIVRLSSSLDLKSSSSGIKEIRNSKLTNGPDLMA